MCNLHVGSSTPLSQKRPLVLFSRLEHDTLAISGTSWIAGLRGLLSTLWERILYVSVNASALRGGFPPGAEFFFFSFCFCSRRAGLVQVVESYRL